VGQVLPDAGYCCRLFGFTRIDNRWPIGTARIAKSRNRHQIVSDGVEIEFI